MLVAEDNPMNQKVAAKMLESLGYAVDVTADGREAVEALSRVPYAVDLMDVHMPEMDGYEATREIRRREKADGHHTPVIALTAGAMRGDKEKALDAGMEDYLSKSVKREELVASLERWTSGQTDAATVPTRPPEPRAAGELEGSLDGEIIENLRGLGDPGLLSELEEVPGRLDALKDAVEKGGPQTVKRIAHTLKGSSGNMGAWRRSRLCLDLEQAGDSEDLSGATGLLRSLNKEFEGVRAELLALAD